MPATVDAGDPHEGREPEGLEGSEPGVARGAHTLTEIIDEFAAVGYVEGFRALPARDGAAPRVQCLRCRADNGPDAMRVDGATRLEGASDPDEMMLVVAMVCPVCGSRGTLALGYGPMASPEDDDVIAALPLDPHHLGFS